MIITFLRHNCLTQYEKVEKFNFSTISQLFRQWNRTTVQPLWGRIFENYLKRKEIILQSKSSRRLLPPGTLVTHSHTPDVVAQFQHSSHFKRHTL